MKYIQIDDTGYTPCGKWRVVPNDSLYSILGEVLDCENEGCSAEVWRDVINRANKAFNESAPLPPAELLLSGEPVGYAHEIRKVDFIHKDVRELLDKFYAEHGFHSQTDRPPIKTTEHYTVPVYLHPTPDAATVRDADRLAWLLADYGNRSAQVFREWDGESDLRAVIDAARGAK